MGGHRSWISHRRPWTTRRNPRHRIPHEPVLRCNLVSAPALIEARQASSHHRGVSTCRSQVENAETRRQRVGMSEPFTTEKLKVEFSALDKASRHARKF